MIEAPAEAEATVELKAPLTARENAVLRQYIADEVEWLDIDDPWLDEDEKELQGVMRSILSKLPKESA